MRTFNPLSLLCFSGRIMLRSTLAVSRMLWILWLSSSQECNGFYQGIKLGKLTCTQQSWNYSIHSLLTVIKWYQLRFTQVILMCWLHLMTSWSSYGTGIMPGRALENSKGTWILLRKWSLTRMIMPTVLLVVLVLRPAVALETLRLGSLLPLYIIIANSNSKLDNSCLKFIDMEDWFHQSWNWLVWRIQSYWLECTSQRWPVFGCRCGPWIYRGIYGFTIFFLHCWYGYYYSLHGVLLSQSVLFFI